MSIFDRSKTCRYCQQILPIEQFQTADGRTRYSKCPECRRKDARTIMQHRKKIDPSYVLGYLIEHFGNQCQRCGYNDLPPVLDFYDGYHPNIKNRFDQLLHQYCYGATLPQWDALVKETYSRVLLCANCREVDKQGEKINFSKLRRDRFWPDTEPPPPVEPTKS